MLTHIMRDVHIPFPEDGRLLCVSDIHAHPHLLRKLLARIEFCERDVLVIAGDVTERGKHSAEALRYTMALCEKGNAYYLAGNMDVWAVSHLSGDMHHSASSAIEKSLQHKKKFGSNVFCSLCEESGISVTTDMDLAAAHGILSEKYRDMIRFVDDAPTVLETEGYLFVHGGLPQEEYAYLLGTDRKGYLKNDNYLCHAPVFQKHLLVCGHTPVQLYRFDRVDASPYLDSEKNVLAIDGGVGLKRDAQLNMLLLQRDGSVFCTWEEDLTDCAEALDPQEENTDTVHVRWGHNRVEELSRADDTAVIRHTETGRVMTVPASYLSLDKEGYTVCRDLSDRLLPVQAGDIVKVITVCAFGAIVKKGGETGWYRGRLRHTTRKPPEPMLRLK